MTLNGWLQIVFFLVLVLLVTKPLGVFMARVFNRERTFLDPVLGPIERLIYRLTRVDAAHEMRWTEYAVAMLLFSLVSLVLLYALQRLQGVLPFNPQQLPGVDSTGFAASAFNTSTSFTTNTNWQSYAPEVTMSYLTQMAGLAYHNFVSAATGIALAIAFIRGIARREVETIGNFWVDLTRATLWVLLPFCLIGALVLVSQGVIQNLRPYDVAKLVDPSGEVTEQVIAQGPVASQEFIKQWGTNGGGFFNSNSAHPFE
ncbi:MAG TPA: potassium-transporting ATPase subunit KdpA, partial [Pyrinomonadaceae bacterium]|nr:potassium-transporting ATPase subunit KdpA [Pyrinomonadaceae bacterium]